jgi:hypothetical protein
MRTQFYTGQEMSQGQAVSSDGGVSPARKPIFGIYNSYYKIRGLLVPISEAPAVEE